MGIQSKNIVRERFDAEKDSAIESALTKAEGWARDIGSGRAGVKLDDILPLLNAIGLKAVERTKCCVDRETYNAYRLLAQRHLNNPPQLEWEDE